jgi:NDP-sugar pyrophosphorylase family protein
MIEISTYAARWASSPFARLKQAPWQITQSLPDHIFAAMSEAPAGYRLKGGAWVHDSAEVEEGAVLKGPIVVGPRCFVASSALLRGGVFLDESCIVGPAVELKTVVMFRGSKVAHLSFVGDSILGSEVNVEAGAVIANYRNELEDKTIRIALAGEVIDAGVDKFGALVGDGSRIGANAVIAPGAILPPASRIGRLTLVDQYPYEAARI